MYDPNKVILANIEAMDRALAPGRYKRERTVYFKSVGVKQGAFSVPANKAALFRLAAKMLLNRYLKSIGQPEVSHNEKTKDYFGEREIRINVLYPVAHRDKVLQIIAGIKKGA